MPPKKSKKAQKNPSSGIVREEANKLLLNFLKKNKIVVIIDKSNTVQSQIDGVLYTVVESGRLIAKYADEVGKPAKPEGIKKDMSN